MTNHKVEPAEAQLVGEMFHRLRKARGEDRATIDRVDWDETVGIYYIIGPGGSTLGSFTIQKLTKLMQRFPPHERPELEILTYKSRP